MPPINWLDYHEVPDVNAEIAKMFLQCLLYANIFFAEKYFDNWDPKIHSPCNCLKGFNVASLIDEYGTNQHYPLAMFRNGI